MLAPMEGHDVVIVGGAVVGSAAAHFLSARMGGQGSVLVLEPDPSYARCATTRSVASVRQQFSTPGNIRMSQFGARFIAQCGELLHVDGQDQPDVGFHAAGYLFLASAAGAATLRANHAIQQAHGAQVALLTQAELRQRFPWLHCDDLAAGALGLAGEGWLDAHSLLQALRRKAIAQGAVYRRARAVELRRTGDRIGSVVLDDGSEIACGWVLNCAGAGAAALARTAGIALPVQARKRCVFFIHSPARMEGCGLLIDPTGAYIRPEGTGFVCGIAPPEDADPEAPDDFEPDHALFDEVVWPTLAQRIPALEAARVQRAWAGHYDVNTLDHNMILGAHPGVENLLFANGFSGHGLQHAPAVGRALSELVLDGGFRSLDLSEFGWERVLAGRPLLEANVV